MFYTDSLLYSTLVINCYLYLFMQHHILYYKYIYKFGFNSMLNILMFFILPGQSGTGSPFRSASIYGNVLIKLVCVFTCFCLYIEGEVVQR